MFRNQQTISEPVTVSGKGYWSGLHATVELRPAGPDSGICFVRRDLAGQPRIDVMPHNCVDIPRRTCVQKGPASVEMIEHIMAALAGLQIDNCEIWVDRAEMPAFDGSCQDLVAKLLEVDVVDQKSTRPTLIIDREISVEYNGSWIKAVPGSGLGLQLRYELHYPQAVIGRQDIELNLTPRSFVTELAAARTFLLDVEADWLRSQGLGRNVSFSDLLVFGPEGVINNELRFNNECVRHKALDVVGDLAVAGFDIMGKVVAHKSGHQLNGQFVRELVKTYHASQPTGMSA